MTLGFVNLSLTLGVEVALKKIAERNCFINPVDGVEYIGVCSFCRHYPNIELEFENLAGME